MGRMGGVLHYTIGFTGAPCNENIKDGGERGTDDFCSCAHCLLEGISVFLSTCVCLFSSGLKMAAENFTMKNVDGFIIIGFDDLQNQKLIGFLILITYMLIFLGNSINLCIILTDRHLQKPMYILICNLAVVDKMFSSSCSITMRAMRAAG